MFFLKYIAVTIAYFRQNDLIKTNMNMTIIIRTTVAPMGHSKIILQVGSGLLYVGAHIVWMVP